MPTPEASLIRKWREAQGLTQQELGEKMEPAVAKNSISNYETGVASMSVATLLRVIRGLDVPGKTDPHRLAMFFLGPEDALVEEAKNVLLRGEEASRRIRRTLDQLAGRAPRR